MGLNFHFLDFYCMCATNLVQQYFTIVKLCSTLVRHCYSMVNHCYSYAT